MIQVLRLKTPKDLASSQLDFMVVLIKVCQLPLPVLISSKSGMFNKGCKISVLTVLISNAERSAARKNEKDNYLWENDIASAMHNDDTDNVRRLASRLIPLLLG